MSNRPLISVIIPCYNYGQYLPEAVQSVMMQASDSLAVEAIVVDDGSTDDTPSVAQQLVASTADTVRYIRQENQGLSGARNTGIRAARGDYLVFLDADDLLCENVLQSHLDTFAAQPELDASVCFSLQTRMHPDSQDEKKKAWLWPLKAAHLDMHLCHSNIAPIHCFMLRTQAARDVGYFDTGLNACEDQDYWLRMAAAGKHFATNPKGMVIYRQHTDSLSHMRPQQLAHDAALRFKISALLEHCPDFPRAGKFYGWLAHAAGTIGSASGIWEKSPQFAAKLVEESARAMLRSAVCRQKREEDPYLNQAEQFFIFQFILSEQSNYISLPIMTKPLAWLDKQYSKHISKGKQYLKEKCISLFQQMAPVPTEIQKKIIRMSTFIEI